MLCAKKKKSYSFNRAGVSFKRCRTSGETHEKKTKYIKPPPWNAFFRRFQKHAHITYRWLRTVSNETRTLLPDSVAFGIPNMFLSHALYILRRMRPWCGMRKTRPARPRTYLTRAVYTVPPVYTCVLL